VIPIVGADNNFSILVGFAMEYFNLIGQRCATIFPIPAMIQTLPVAGTTSARNLIDWKCRVVGKAIALCNGVGTLIKKAGSVDPAFSETN
jgi:hypothetical protein